MRALSYILIFILWSSYLFALDNGYFIYKLLIDSDNHVTLQSSTYVNGNLKIPRMERYLHDPFVYRIISEENEIIYQKEFVDPRILYLENYSDIAPTKSTVVLESAYFVIKVPVFDNTKKIDFYRTNNITSELEKISEIITDVK